MLINTYYVLLYLTKKSITLSVIPFKGYNDLTSEKFKLHFAFALSETPSRILLLNFNVRNSSLF